MRPREFEPKRRSRRPVASVPSGDRHVLKACTRGRGQLKSTRDDAIKAAKGEAYWAFLTDQRMRVERATEELKARC